MKLLLVFLTVLSARAEMTDRERLRWYWRTTYGPVAVLRSGFAAGTSHLANDPEEWRQGAAGYGRRFASRFGRGIVENTIEGGVGWAVGEDPRYKRHPEWSGGKRVWHALRSTVVWRTDAGQYRPAVAKVGGIYGGAMISMAWYPDRYRATGDGLRMANVRLGTSAATNLVREFWPEIRRLIKR